MKTANSTFRTFKMVRSIKMEDLREMKKALKKYVRESKSSNKCPQRPPGRAIRVFSLYNSNPKLHLSVSPEEIKQLHLAQSPWEKKKKGRAGHETTS